MPGNTATLTLAVAYVVVSSLNLTNASPLTLTIAQPAYAHNTDFRMGTMRRPDGKTLTLDHCSLLLNGKRWMPVMGEFHYSRYPENEWREELLKMKAGGVDTVATYVFWIHHEEIEGQWDWSGRRNLRRFVQLCQEAGMKVLVRCGPWDHGEARNGGFPDWLERKGWETRSNDTNYLEKTKILYGQIAGQLDGLLWKDAGPVIGIQFENEFTGPAEHLLALKRLAREAGLDVPLYTRTGWPNLRTPLPFGEIVPLYAVYAEGFWDRELTSMPDGYWQGFHFSPQRTDNAIGSDILGTYEAKDPPDVGGYPYLTCEIGAGIMSSYHRRLRFYPEDAESTTLVKLGSGGVSVGYYMYHGGENPDGKLTTLQESQTTGYWNDLPVKNYDFQTALGEYGQARPQYHRLRRLHLFLHEWGSQLAEMPSAMPDQRPRGKDDFETLRWSVRSAGDRGFVFINNYQRLQELPSKKNVQFTIKLAGGSLTFPQKPITVPSGACCFWPFNLDLGKNVRLAWATAQPVSTIDEGNIRTIFFAETKDVPAEFAFDSDSGLKAYSGKISRNNGRAIIYRVKTGTGPAIQITGKDGGIIRILLLSDSDSLALWKGSWLGRDRMFLTAADLILDGDRLRLTSFNPRDLKVGVYPALDASKGEGNKNRSKADGIFERFTPPEPRQISPTALLEAVQPAGPPRDIPMGKIKNAVAAAPEEADFAQAAVWRVKLPASLDLSADPLLRFRYVGDVARVTLNGRLLTDDFYNGNPFEIGLRRYAPEILSGDLRIEILPLRKGAPILLPREARPNFAGASSVVALKQAEIVPRYQLHLSAHCAGIDLAAPKAE